MTRENLIEAISECDKGWSCPSPSTGCDLPEYEGNTGDCCRKCAERLLDEYENKKDEDDKMLKCKICGKEFEANIERHYISSDNDITGLSSVIIKEEVTLYDTFDCPSCGCQVIAQERKRSIIKNDECEDECDEGYQE